MGSDSEMPAARLGDIDTGHPPYPPTPVITGSTNVFINGRPAARKGDMLAPHHPGIRIITEGSASVFINGKPAARVSDSVNCGGKIVTGSPNVQIGNKPGGVRNAVTSAEFSEYIRESLKPGNIGLSPKEEAQLAADVAVKYRGPEGAIATWHDYFMGNEPEPGDMGDAARKEGFQRAQTEKGLASNVIAPAAGEIPSVADLAAQQGLVDRKSAAENLDSWWDRADARMQIIQDQRAGRIPGRYEQLQDITSAMTGRKILPDVDTDSALDSLNGLPGAGPMLGGATTIEARALQGAQRTAGKLAQNVSNSSQFGILRSSSEYMGVEPASQKLLAAVGSKRSLVIAKPGSDELRMLDYFGAEASVGGPNNSSILLRENPSKAAVLEEFLHGTQARLGVTDRLGTSGLGSAETHVKDFMIRHQSMLGLGDEDVGILKVLRDKGL